MEPADVVHIEMIQAAIATGSYAVPALAVADAILAYHLGGPGASPRPA
jgi:anti-sigma28 factor (negative regulator of flagellin synthesis)